MSASSALNQLGGAVDASVSSPTREAAMWVTTPEGPMCVRVHLPADGRARGSVVLCPPLAREHAVTHSTFRQLAEELATAGFVALRIDYYGTGDSVGSQTDPCQVAAWQNSVREAVRAAHRVHGGPVTVVGMRMGALLAATAVSAPGFTGGIDQLILWDVCATGNSWLREQRALLEIGVGSSGYGAVPTQGDAEDLRKASAGREHVVDIPSFSFSETEAAAISALDLAALSETAARRVVAMHREERTPRASVTTRLAALGAEQVTCVGQSDLLVIASDFALVPIDGLRQVVRTIEEATVDERTECSVPATASAVLRGSNAAGLPVSITEEHVRLGPTQLVGVRTQPERDLPGAPLLIMIGNSNEPHVGPSRSWVELARRWAAEGLTSVRVSLSGLGDSPVRPGQSPQVIYANEAQADVRDVIEAATGMPGGRHANVVLIGLCSGGYEAIEAALNLGARGIAVLGVIPGSGQPNVLLSSGTAPIPVRSGEETQRLASAPVKGWAYRAAQLPLAWKVAAKLPALVWWIADRVGVFPSPARPLQRLVAARVDTFFLVGERDARPYRLMAGATLHRLERTGTLQFSSIPALDHGMLRAGPREKALTLLDAHVRARFVAPHLQDAS